MTIERGLIDPARMKIKQARIADGSKYVDGETTWFVADSSHLIPQGPRSFAFLVGANMEARKDKQFHANCISGN